jgi:hypothetical protein
MATAIILARVKPPHTVAVEAQLIGGQRCSPSVRARAMCRRRCVLLERVVFRCPCAAGGTIGQDGR